MTLKVKKLRDIFMCLKYFRELTCYIQQSSEPKEIDLTEERKKK